MDAYLEMHEKRVGVDLIYKCWDASHDGYLKMFLNNILIYLRRKYGNNFQRMTNVLGLRGEEKEWADWGVMIPTFQKVINHPDRNFRFLLFLGFINACPKVAARIKQTCFHPDQFEWWKDRVLRIALDNKMRGTTISLPEASSYVESVADVPTFVVEMIFQYMNACYSEVSK